MNCVCHGEAAYWQKDKRCKQGGWWECAVKRREREMARYDASPVYRIERQLQIGRRRRGMTLKRRRETFGALQIQRLDRPAVEQHSPQDHTAA